MNAAPAGAPPDALPVNPDGIAGQLKARAQWVGWDWQWIADDARWTKVPFNPKTGKHASSTNPATWATFEAALAFAEHENLPGVGFVVTIRDPYVGIDLDKCRNPDTGKITAEALAIIAFLDSYTEITPSGTGLRVWITTGDGLLPGGEHGRRRGWIEAYGAERYFTVTGHRLTRDVS